MTIEKNLELWVETCGYLPVRRMGRTKWYQIFNRT